MTEQCPHSMIHKNPGWISVFMDPVWIFAYFNKAFTVFTVLCDLFDRKKMASGSFILYLCVKLIEIIAHTQ